MDFASRWVARLLYPLGISTDPKQVVIGRDGWTFLGDQYEKTLTVDRRLANKADFVLGEQMGSAAEAWDVYLSSKGVKNFNIMIGPNKGTIYPEYMPDWAMPASPNATDALLARTGLAHYVDLRGALLAAKNNQSDALYYKTDTHWNSLGAGIAFRAFAQQVSKTAPELQWPSEKTYAIDRVEPRGGGDLANFLRLTSYLPDIEPIIHASKLSIETTQSDFDTGQVLVQGGNPMVGSPDKPLLVKSIGALNSKRVLWLRDSFGTAMSPLMAATFSDVLQLHWGEAIKPGGRFVQLVEKWKPDYVFVTVVERASRTPWFAIYPPPVFAPRGRDFKATVGSALVGTNDILRGISANEFHMNGHDSSVIFLFDKTVTRTNAPFLSVELTCADGSPSVPLQLFWLEEGQPIFDEEHSARFSFRTGQNLIDLRTIPKWGPVTAIRRIRLDIDTQNSCRRFKLENASLGANRNGAMFRP